MINRRDILRKIIFFSLGSSFLNWQVQSRSISDKRKLIYKKIPNTLEKLPVIGMGSWLTFDIGYDKEALIERTKILKIFFNSGGSIIDSSPMYGRSEKVIGKCLTFLKNEKKSLFSASKIWTPNGWHGKKQFENSQNLWGLKKFSLMQVHNLVNYEGHLEYLNELKNKGIIKYLGITTSHGWRHEKLRFVMENYDVDFVQLTYNLVDNEAENFLLPIAKEKKIAVIANRPFQGGKLFDYIKNKKIPNQVLEFGINNWAELFLKFIVSHPAITCTIPATSKAKHMHENMGAMYGHLPAEKERKKIKSIFLSI